MYIRSFLHNPNSKQFFGQTSTICQMSIDGKSDKNVNTFCPKKKDLILEKPRVNIYANIL